MARGLLLVVDAWMMASQSMNGSKRRGKKTNSHVKPIEAVAPSFGIVGHVLTRVARIPGGPGGNRADKSEQDEDEYGQSRDEIHFEAAQRTRWTESRPDNR